MKPVQRTNLTVCVYGPSSLCRALVFGVGFLASVSVLAGDWTITPRVTVEEVFSDNIQLAADGAEKSDFVTDVSPGISVHGRGGRIDVNFDYNLQALSYAHDKGPNSINHQLQALANVEVIRQIVFLDLRSTVSQENLSNTGPLADSNISVTGNRRGVITYSVNPIVRHRLGSYADGEVRYIFDKIINDGATVDTDSTGMTATLSSGRRFGNLPWTLNYERSKLENSSGTTSKFQNASADVRYLFTRRYAVFGDIGMESNEFATSQSDDSGVSWRAGFAWTPTERSTFEVGYGKRFFGSNIYLNMAHGSRRTAWTARYEEDTSTTSQVQLERQLIPLVDAFGEPIVDPTSGANIVIPVDTATITDEVFVRRVFQGSVSARGRRTTASLNVSAERREFQLSGDEETVYNVSANANRRLSQRTTLSASAGWQASEARATGRDSTRWDFGFGLNHRLGRDLSGTVDYRHVEQDSAAGGSDYSENRFTVGLNVLF